MLLLLQRAAARQSLVDESKVARQKLLSDGVLESVKISRRCPTKLINEREQLQASVQEDFVAR